MRVTLRNDFHNTEAKVIVPDGGGRLSPQATRRAFKKLCGMSDCTCGSVRGEQDLPSDWSVQTEGYPDRLVIGRF